MNSRNSVHRIQQRQLAERQRYLSELEALQSKLRDDVELLQAQIATAGDDRALPTDRQPDPLFSRTLLERRDKLFHSIGEIDTQIEEARKALAAAQQEARLVEGGLSHRGLNFEDRLTRRARRSM